MEICVIHKRSGNIAKFTTQIFCFSLSLVFIIIWQAAIHTYGELTDSFFWLAEFSAGILVSQINRFLFCKSLAYFHFANFRFLFCKSSTYFLFANYRFLFCKLSAYFHFANHRFSFCFVSFCFTNCSKPVVTALYPISVARALSTFLSAPNKMHQTIGCCCLVSILYEEGGFRGQYCLPLQG